MAMVGENLVDELADEIGSINAGWLAYCEARFLMVEDGLFDPSPLALTRSDVDDALAHAATLQPGQTAWHLIKRASVADITGIVVRAYSRTDEWSAGMTPSLKQRSTLARRRATEDFLTGAGRSLPQDWKIGGWAKASKDQRAISSVGEMRKSFNNRLTTWVSEVKDEWVEQQGSLRGLNRNSMAARLRAKIETFQNQYSRVAGVTEVQTQYDLQLRELVNRNGVDPPVVILPEGADSRCRWGCPDWAGNEYLFSETPDFPLHPNCIHFRKIVPGSFPLPGGSVDLGGRSLYLSHNVPEA